MANVTHNIGWTLEDITKLMFTLKAREVGLCKIINHFVERISVLTEGDDRWTL